MLGKPPKAEEVDRRLRDRVGAFRVARHGPWSSAEKKETATSISIDRIRAARDLAATIAAADGVCGHAAALAASIGGSDGSKRVRCVESLARGRLRGAKSSWYGRAPAALSRAVRTRGVANDGDRLQQR